MHITCILFILFTYGVICIILVLLNIGYYQGIWERERERGGLSRYIGPGSEEPRSVPWISEGQHSLNRFILFFYFFICLFFLFSIIFCIFRKNNYHIMSNSIRLLNSGCWSYESLPMVLLDLKSSILREVSVYHRIPKPSFIIVVKVDYPIYVLYYCCKSLAILYTSFIIVVKVWLSYIRPLLLL
jgi:hypothetical protein